MITDYFKNIVRIYCNTSELSSSTLGRILLNTSAIRMVLTKGLDYYELGFSSRTSQIIPWYQFMIDLFRVFPTLHDSGEYGIDVEMDNVKAFVTIPEDFLSALHVPPMSVSVKES